MKNSLDSIEEILLMGPGPSCVPPEVYRALARPTLGHLDPAFIAIMDEVKVMLRTVMKTSNRLTLPISGTGSAGMEACFVNLVEPGDAVLVLVNGVFSTRMSDVAGRLGALVDTLQFEWGTPVDPQRVKEKLASKRYRIVAMVHAETSTGVCNPVAEVAALLAPETLFIVDTVTSLGGMPVEADAWKADAMYSGSQKCLSVPPGLAPATFSARALERIKGRKAKVPNWYLDMGMVVDYWDGAKRAYHHTAPINMIYALHQGLSLVLAEGLPAVYSRHLEMHRRLVAGLEKLGVQMLVAPGARLPMLNAMKVPAGMDEAAGRAALRDRHKIEVGAGLGPLAGKIWRIGLMGHTARAENVDRCLAALGDVLGRR
jgi:alanine-glyoxylate transaminase / serine-glyoxylate transaminase / serine-pyruvate transaminase